jgi:hypothetical protein
MVLKDIGHGLQHGWIENNGVQVDCSTGIRIAVRSGHGIGKSALMAMLDHWFVSTHPNPQSVTTANTDTQLKSKTWREMAKWHKLLINNHWFKWTATKLICLAEPETWYSSAIPWSENNPEAFAGTHEKYLMAKFDEASAIPDIIWEVTEGAMTESNGLKIWVVFGNPTKPTGRFSECFKRHRKYWVCYEIDSRTSKRTDHALLQQWIDLYGEDSDFVRVRVKGQEPRSGAKQFIPNDIVDAALGKVINPSTYIDSPKIIGVDIALEGNDQTAVIIRQGLAAYGLKKFRESDALKLSGVIAQIIQEQDPDAVFIDNGNIGPVIVQNLHRWGYANVVMGVNFGGQSALEQCKNKRAEMWWRLRDWLVEGAMPNDSELRDDLIGPESIPDEVSGKVLLEKKKDMKSRGLPSPDCGDALALTFAFPVQHRSAAVSNFNRRTAKTNYDLLDFDNSHGRGGRQPAKSDYDIFNP